MRSRKTIPAIAAAIAAFCAFAAPASAGTIRYDIQPSDAYEIQDNGQGIVKVTFRNCLIAGSDATVSFAATMRATQGGSARWNILQESGGTPDSPRRR